jgi:hypothetical protein
MHQSAMGRSAHPGRKERSFRVSNAATPSSVAKGGDGHLVPDRKARDLESGDGKEEHRQHDRWR